MKKIIFLIYSILATMVALAATPERVSFNDGWRFFNEEIEGAECTVYNDKDWRELDLPHDWAIEGSFSEEYNARCGGLPFHGTGWYRKSFTLDPNDSGKVVNILFDGAMSDAHLWVNGEFVGSRPYGYVSFYFDISEYLRYDGSENIIAVRLQPADLSSRWYPGAGIYRNVWLYIDEPQHIPIWGTYIATPFVTAAEATVEIETMVENAAQEAKDATINYTVLSPAGNVVAKKSANVRLSASNEAEAAVWMNIIDPERWDIYTPKLYSLICEVEVDGKVVDQTTTQFGIRSIRYDKDGFYINNRKVRFNGVCLHHDNGPLGGALYRRADERKLQIMKQMGANAIRTAHNPVAPEFLDLCDEMGFVVVNEIFDGWQKPKTENDYGQHFAEWSERDVENIIRRDRNHPSVIMWSIGNEVPEQSNKVDGWREAKRLAEITRREDPTRPSTIGFNQYCNMYLNNLVHQVDIVGLNYKPTKYSEIAETFPEMPFYGSETSSCTSSRGVYHLPLDKYEIHKSLQISSYDFIAPSWAYPPDVEFYNQQNNPRSMGEFVWTGFDYLGEPTPYGGKDNFTNGYWNGHWPARSSYFGTVDLCGIPKDRYYLYQSQWSREPMVHLLPHWNWEGKEGDIIPIYAYTNCDEAELFLNGRSLGKLVKGKDLTTLKVEFKTYADTLFHSPYRLSWNVPYERGELKVVAYRDGRSIIEKIIKTAGKPYKITLSADRKLIAADGKDLSYVTVSIEDKDGNICPMADNLVEFKIKGTGTLLAVGNGNPATTESFQAPHRRAFSGKCMAIIKSETNRVGDIELIAKSKGLRGESIIIQTK